MGNETHFTGACSELEVAKRLAGMGYEIFFPVMTQSQIDLIAVRGSECLRVQVKTASKIKSGGFDYLQVRLQSRCSGSGYTRDYSETQFDKIAIVYGDNVWLCPWCEIYGTKSITLGRFEDGVLKPRTKGRKIPFDDYLI